MFIASNGQHFILDKFKYAGVGVVPRPCTRGKQDLGPVQRRLGLQPSIVEGLGHGSSTESPL